MFKIVVLFYENNVYYLIFLQHFTINYVLPKFYTFFEYFEIFRVFCNIVLAIRKFLGYVYYIRKIENIKIFTNFLYFNKEKRK